VVVGATGGIGRAVTLRLAKRSFRIYLIARNTRSLDALRIEVERLGGEAVVEEVDLFDENSVDKLVATIRHQEPLLDRLVHAAGYIDRGTTESASKESLERHLTVNFKAPYCITRGLIPSLVAASGQVVFVNSTAVHFPNAETGQYAASKHALKGFADSLRAELNPRGVRVLSIFPGRTATEMQSTIHGQEERVYQPERLLQPDDIATMIEAASDLADTAEVTEIHIRPMRKIS
jgi:NADP-dependent 3-hydroxy acid dehydrogenase YdfG